MRPPRFLFLVLLIVGTLGLAVRAAEPFFKKGDVIAIVGGEDMVALSEYGYLELLLTRALPDFHLRFRNLAWEGDTVFEQRRELNFPTWEEQLEKIGATVVLCQFGQMESLAGQDKLPEFIAAYERLVKRLAAGGKRKVVFIEPSPIKTMSADGRGYTVSPCSYTEAILTFASDGRATKNCVPLTDGRGGLPGLRDTCHLNDWGHLVLAGKASNFLSHQRLFPTNLDADEPLRQLIIAKNRLWFDYWRVQNWAFLAGDRTNQPSSRDHLDPQKRWFPEEREKFIPLIEAREKEIDTLAAKPAKP